MTRYYTAIIFLNILAMILIQICIEKSNTLTVSRKKIFHALFNVIIVCAFCEWMGNYLQGSGESTRIIHIVVKAIELSLAPSIAFLISFMIEKKREREINFFLAIHAVIECLSGVWGFIYYVDKDSNYVHGSFYWIYMLAYILSMLYCIYIVLKNVKKYQYNGSGFFLLVVGYMLIGICIQMYDSSLKVDYVTVSIVSIMLYVFTLEMIYQTDELTELINRRGYENYISHIEEKCIILFFDVDNFKMINDTYGHAFGDVVLRNVGMTIRDYYARYGKCFRYGGDEFCVVLTKHIDQVEQLNERFFHAMEEQRKKESRMPYISVGYSYYDRENQNMQDTVAEADQMMYRYKETHKEQRQGRA